MLAGIIVLVAVVVGMFWALQRSMIYFPDTSPVPPAGEALIGGQKVEDRELAVLVAPGNAANRYNRLGLAETLQAQGFSVLLMDYRGYSTNPGRPTQDGLIRDGHAAVEALEQQGLFTRADDLFWRVTWRGSCRCIAYRTPAGVVFGHRLPSCAPNFVNEHIVDADHNDPQMHGAAVAHVVAELADVISPHD